MSVEQILAAIQTLLETAAKEPNGLIETPEDEETA
jgi:hypothetical protein